jgi:hypothetical protein
MATAKERGHKDWGFGGVVKRDFKSDKSDGEYNSPRDYAKRWYTNTKRVGIKKNRKDTKRWCRGKENREHIWAYYKKYNFGNWWEYKCTLCHKEEWTRPKYGLLQRVSYHSNDEFDLVPMEELKF